MKKMPGKDRKPVGSSSVTTEGSVAPSGDTQMSVSGPVAMSSEGSELSAPLGVVADRVSLDANAMSVGGSDDALRLSPSFCGRIEAPDLEPVQPFYNLQPGHVTGYLPKPEDWTHGLCTVFACALQERFGFPMYAMVEEAESDGHQTVVHAFCLVGDKALDGDGICDVPTPADYVAGGQIPDDDGYYPGEPSVLKIIPVTRELLHDLHYVEDMDDIASALWFIEHSPQFDAIRSEFSNGEPKRLPTPV